MTEESFNFNWETYPDHTKQMMKSLMTSKSYSDITLICEDKTQLLAGSIKNLLVLRKFCHY